MRDWLTEEVCIKLCSGANADDETGLGAAAEVRDWLTEEVCIKLCSGASVDDDVWFVARVADRLVLGASG